VQEVRAAHDIIDRLSDYLARPLDEPRIAIVWDTDDLIWSEMWPILGKRRTLFADYPREIQEVHHQLSKRGLRPTYTRFGADWSAYEAVIVWDHALADGKQCDQIRRYVEAGGTVVANYALGFLTREGRRTACPIPLELTDVFGCTVRDMFKVDDAAFVARWGDARIQPEQRVATLSAEGGEVLARWPGWQGEHNGAVVVHRLGQGRTLYLGAQLGRPGWRAFAPQLLEHLGMSVPCPIADDPRIEAIPDRGGWVVCNNERTEVDVPIEGVYQDLVSGDAVRGTLSLNGHAIAVLQPLEK